ncbi:MAG TPA: 3-hydroxy-5-phosphonooxypentane-2,4-dione thiolase, partial [bacterium]|nr:3-hydroxy-5-phosphonooxypentane-2,4-dione thiolase [bacterium]
RHGRQARAPPGTKAGPVDWGMRNRLNRIIRPETGRTVMLAVDHGYFMGPTTKLEVPRKTIEPLLPFADSLMVTRGVVRSSLPPEAAVPIVLRVSGGTSILAEDLSDEGIMTTMKDAVRLGAAAVALSVFIGTRHERETLLNLGALVSEGHEYGMPVLAVTAVGKELEKRDARYLALACRIAAEAGAQIVKTYYCDGFDKVVEGCPVPLVVAGGPKLDTELDVFELTSRAVRQGAAGVDMGRNIWQHPSPVAMLKAVRAIVHEDASPEDAHALFQRVRAEGQAAARR